MRCKYCFYHDVAENREIESYGIMSDETMKILIDRAFEFAGDGGAVSFAFQGGEPTVCGVEFFQKFVAYVKQKNTGRTRISYGLQTNGLNINEDYCRLFHENNFLVGLSMDGTKELHDLNRVDAKRNGTFSRVLKAAEMMTKYKVEFNILCVVSEQNAKKAETLYNFYKNHGFNYIQYIPQIAPFSGENEYSTLSPEAYGKFLSTTFDLWYRDFERGKYVSIRDFDNYGGILMGRRPEICSLQGVCSCNPTVEANGNVYPCDFYVLDEYLLGNLKDMPLSDMLQSETAKKFIRESFVRRDECESCEWKQICRTGCRRNKEPLEKTGGEQYFCKAYKVFFENCFERMKKIPMILNTKYNK